jgi:hypothetical protein
MSLIHNERTKLTANTLDRASTACVAAAFITPGATLGFTPIASLSTLVWLFAAFALHIAARWSLGRLQP